MHCLSTAELIPEKFRASASPSRCALDSTTCLRRGAGRVRPGSVAVTVYIGLTGIDGATFKRERLMDKFGIQINKTSRNTVLFMTNIGTTYWSPI